MLQQYCTFTSLSVLAFSVYFAITARNIYNIIDPKFDIAGRPTIDSLWEEGIGIYAECYLTPRANWEHSDFDTVIFVGNFTGLTFDWKDNHRFTDISISKSFLEDQIHEPHKETTASDLWYSLRHNATLFLHVHLTQEGASPNPDSDRYNRYKTIHQSNPLVRYAPRKNARKSYLLEPILRKWNMNYFYSTEITDELDEDAAEGPDPALNASVISYWKPHMAIRLVTDFRKYPYQEMPRLVYQSLQFVEIREPASDYRYLPAMYVDESGLKFENLIPLNRTIHSLPLKISFEPMSFARWHVLLNMEFGLNAQQSLLGIGDESNGPSKDAEMLRNMVADTNPYLLAVTMTVSLLHILFDWLAFKNDISFWREKRDMIGVSLHSLLVSVMSQFVIVLYLIDEETTLLVLVPGIISLIIDTWKVLKCWSRSQQSDKGTARLNATNRADSVATKYMMLALGPLILGYALYSLVYEQHRGWYAWILGSLTGAVYAFGFIMMTPQLFINYRLKSVAHLSWKFLIYRALNTFIDDLFAFIIDMPTMHRLSCFRDDIVFLIYVYQRYKYPVDQTRLHDEDTAEKVKEE